MESYQQTLDYLYRRLPMYQRVGAAAYKNDLTNTLALCAALDHPEKKFRSIHVAGTNGKGSSSHMLAAILQSAGYRTGLYTSPHLKRFTERIKINGAEVPEHFVIDFVCRLQPDIERISPSFFEATVAMAFDFFAREQVDVAVVEVGLGGRLDSTNVITPLVSLITNISFDHMDLLGDTLPKIAAEKAGIIKPGVPVVVSERQPETAHVFIDRAAAEASQLEFAADRYRVRHLGGGDFEAETNGRRQQFELALKGGYQQKNLAGVLAVVDWLRGLGFVISDDALRKGLRSAATLTGLKGRWQKLGEDPLMYCDTGHNEAGVREVLSELAKLHANRLHLVWGMVGDKDPSAVLSLLPTEATYYFCAATIPRAMSAADLAMRAQHYGLTGVVIPDVNAAIAAAKKASGPGDVIFIGGSTFVVAEIDNL